MALERGLSHVGLITSTTYEPGLVLAAQGGGGRGGLVLGDGVGHLNCNVLPRMFQGLMKHTKNMHREGKDCGPARVKFRAQAMAGRIPPAAQPAARAANIQLQGSLDNSTTTTP
jgi:hypothetical protein